MGTPSTLVMARQVARASHRWLGAFSVKVRVDTQDATGQKIVLEAIHKLTGTEMAVVLTVPVLERVGVQKTVDKVLASVKTTLESRYADILRN